MSDDDIVAARPGLTRTDLQAAFDYAAAHPEEMSRSITQNEEGEEGFVE